MTKICGKVGGADIYVVSISCMKTKVVRFQSMTHFVNDSVSITSMVQHVECLQTKAYYVKLPGLEMVMYEGNLEGCTTFWDHFHKSIYVNDQPPKVDKFRCLASYLTGIAAEVISRLLITEANYDIAM